MKKLLYVVTWIPVTLIFTFPLVMGLPFTDVGWWSLLPVGLIPLGLVLVPIALLFDEWPKLLWLWGNDEEDCPDWWKEDAATGGEGWLAKKFPCWWWYAVRNPVNNHRYVFKDRTGFKTQSNWDQDIPMEAQQLVNQGKGVAYRWQYDGWFAGYRRVWLESDGKYSEFWWGWKVGSEVPGLGFTMQWRRKRKIGT